MAPANPGLAPKLLSRCEVCKSTADIADVNLRIWLPDGTRQPGGVIETTDYLIGIGTTGSDAAIRKRIRTHMRHVEEWLENPVLAPMQVDDRVVRLVELADVKFPTVEQKALNVGALSLDMLGQRIQSGLVEDETLVMAAKLGASVASKKGDRAAKGADEKLDMLQRMLSGAE